MFPGVFYGSIGPYLAVPSYLGVWIAGPISRPIILKNAFFSFDKDLASASFKGNIYSWRHNGYTNFRTIAVSHKLQVG